jgi:hypothetical protein
MLMARSNKRVKFARTARPTRKGNAPLLALTRSVRRFSTRSASLTSCVIRAFRQTQNTFIRFRKRMRTFLATYIGSVSSSEKAQSPIPADVERAGMEAWGRWIAEHASLIHDYGTPLGKTKRVSANGIIDAENRIVGYVIVKAESHEAAAKIFEEHPHFSVFPGDSVEVMECLAMPGA